MLQRSINIIRDKLMEVYYLRIKRNYVAYARWLGVRVGEYCRILSNPKNIFGSEPWLIKLGDHVEVTQGVRFITHEGGLWCVRWLKDEYHDLDKFAPISVGNNVMIGMNSLIMPGVTIGDNVIIGGYSVVTRDVPSDTIVAGVPAKEISTIEKFVGNVGEECVATKKMTQEEKKKYLMEMHPEWFE